MIDFSSEGLSPTLWPLFKPNRVGGTRVDDKNFSLSRENSTPPPHLQPRYVFDRTTSFSYSNIGFRSVHCHVGTCASIIQISRLVTFYAGRCIIRKHTSSSVMPSITHIDSRDLFFLQLKRRLYIISYRTEVNIYNEFPYDTT